MNLQLSAAILIAAAGGCYWFSDSFRRVRGNRVLTYCLVILSIAAAVIGLVAAGTLLQELLRVLGVPKVPAV